MRVQPEAALISKNPGLKIKKVPRIDHCFSVKRESEIWQALGDEHTQARVIDRETAQEWIDRENGGLGRKPEDCFHVRAGLQICFELAEEGLENVVLKQLRRI